jgi:hypothetical protein
VPQQNTYTHDIAISAVHYDAMLVSELSERLGPRLGTTPFWAGNESVRLNARTTPLRETGSRLALVLHQRLWRHDSLTKSDDAPLRDRIVRRPESLRIVTLDDEPVPAWLVVVPRCDLALVGVDGVVEFAVEAIAASGGTPMSAASALESLAEAPRRWPEGPSSFLAQPRAVAALRRELDLLAAEVRDRLRLEEAPGTPRTVDLQLLPNRLVVRVAGVGITFSWLPSGVGTVADGRLLVIQWAGAATHGRGIAALTLATPVRERVYRPEGRNAESWKWRADSPNGRAWSSAHLAAEWLASASLAASV